MPDLRSSADQVLGNEAHRRYWSRFGVLGTTTMLLGASMTLAAIAGVKKVAHPEVKVTIYHVYERDAAFEKMRSAFADAVRRKTRLVC